MTAPSTRDTVVAAARDLFARRGYTATTIKDVAAAAGCSPALVMKLMGSKSALFAAADPSATVLDEAPAAEEGIGYQLVRRMLDRYDNDDPEPLAMAPVLIHEADDPDTTRDDIRRRYVAAIAERIGDTTEGRVRAHLVLAALLGLAGGLRTVGLLGPDVVDREDLILRYGAVLQTLVDDPLDAGATGCHR